MVRDGTARRSQEFLVIRTTHRAQEGQRLASLGRLSSAQCLNHSRLLSRSPHDYAHLVVVSSPRSTWRGPTAKLPSILAISRRPPSPLLSACATPPRRSNASWAMCCEDSTSVSPTWMTSTFSPSHWRSTSGIYGCSSTIFKHTGS
jgi:hypothetical protein